MGACIQNGFTVRYRNAVLELVVDKELEIWTGLPHSFAQGMLTTAARLVEFV